MAVETLHGHGFPPAVAAMHESRPHAPGAALYVLWGLFWVLMLVIAVQDSMSIQGIRWWQPILWEGSSGVFATVWLMLQRRLADRRYWRYLDRPLLWFWHHLKWLPPVAATFIPAVYAFRHGVYALLGESYRHQPWTFVIVYESFKLALFMGLWLGIIFGFNSFVQWRSQRERLLAMQKSLSEAQLSQLKAQLRPHFLFNALNTISSLMHVDVEQADRTLARLGDLLRTSLQAGERDLIALRDELNLLQLYAQIMEARFADRVQVRWHVDEAIQNVAVPALLLQPLLENAFKHGVERSGDAQEICIAAQRHGDMLELAVHNTGATLEENRRDGVGLRNSRERLRALYGAEATLALVTDATGVEARITIPYREHIA